MKLSYDIIKSNIETYNKAKELLPVITQFENGEVDVTAMRSLNLSHFAEFYEFLKISRSSGFNPIIPDMDWRKLKPMLIEKTEHIRFKKFISNRTQNQFISLLNDAEDYDRLLNGRWISKPRRTRRGRISSGRRSDECLSGLQKCIFPIINYIIQNDLDVFDSKKVDCYDIPSFNFQDRYKQILQWYTNSLSIDNIPMREIEVTNKLIDSFVSILTDLKIDPRKLNLEYVTNSISSRIKKGMIVPDNTNIKCLRDIIDSTNRLLFAKDKIYKVSGSYISNGSTLVYLTNDLGKTQYVKYVDFEDMSVHRDSLLDNLFGE